MLGAWLGKLEIRSKFIHLCESKKTPYYLYLNDRVLKFEKRSFASLDWQVYQRVHCFLSAVSHQTPAFDKNLSQ